MSLSYSAEFQNVFTKGNMAKLGVEQHRYGTVAYSIYILYFNCYEITKASYDDLRVGAITNETCCLHDLHNSCFRTIADVINASSFKCTSR